jgi:hypothetical protein
VTEDREGVTEERERAKESENSEKERRRAMVHLDDLPALQNPSFPERVREGGRRGDCRPPKR